MPKKPRKRQQKMQNELKLFDGVWTCVGCRTENTAERIGCCQCSTVLASRAAQHRGAIDEVNRKIKHLTTELRYATDELQCAKREHAERTRAYKQGLATRIPFNAFLTLAREHQDAWTEMDTEPTFGCHLHGSHLFCMGTRYDSRGCWYETHLNRVDEVKLYQIDSLEGALEGEWIICNTCSIDTCLEMWDEVHRNDPIRDTFVSVSLADFGLSTADVFPLFVDE